MATSLLAFWLGGGSSTAAQVTPGFRSMLAPWLGGASSTEQIIVVQEEQEVRGLPWWLRDLLLRKKEEELFRKQLAYLLLTID